MAQECLEQEGLPPRRCVPLREMLSLDVALEEEEKSEEEGLGEGLPKR